MAAAAACSLILLLGEHEIQHPAVADVWVRSAAMVKDIRVIAPGIFKGVT
jgi:hypothetical protein